MKPSLKKILKTDLDNVNPIHYALAQIPTPIFNTPQIPFHQIPLKRDDQGRLMEIEMIALPGTKFQCFNKISEHLIQVKTAEYPSEIPLYVDRRFLSDASEKTPERKKNLPTMDEILNWMQARLGLPYFWGGNWGDGIPEIFDFYPSLKKALPDDRRDASCYGLDCSGILYQATNGSTPRNTSSLVNFGKEISIEERKPLDLLVWKGHVIIVLTRDTLIESRIGKGVVISRFDERYLEVLDLLQKQNKALHVRRWHPES